jgi:hypothetical protein
VLRLPNFTIGVLEVRRRSWCGVERSAEDRFVRGDSADRALLLAQPAIRVKAIGVDPSFKLRTV